MACYHPLTGYDLTPKYFTCQETRKIVFNVNPVLASELSRQGRVLSIPCGQCIGCRLEYSRQWANRCMLELPYHDQAWFVTLTYDDAHVPKTFSVDPETGEAISPVMTLRKRHFQLFMKQLRYRFSGDHIRFFAAGEYGTNSLRPHYHAILFGLHLKDLVLYKRSVLDYPYFNSESLSRCWVDSSDGSQRGYVVAGAVSWDTCAYVARYILKKQKGATASVYQELNIEPEFSLMSRKPGIGRQYYDDHPDMFKYDKINVKTPAGGRSFTHPLYLRRLYEIDDPVGSFELSEKRRLNAVDNVSLKTSLTDLDYYDILISSEQRKERSLKSLFRTTI
ncbi:MAG: replication initiator protein [Microviridae sp.]|nr:MAG: replication initiator protein [Microviridae sp.]